MELLKIRINSLEDAKNGIPVLEGILREQLKPTKDFTVAILEAGTEQGQTSLMFALKNADGTYSVAECTAKQFEALYAAYKGAEQRFEEGKSQKN